ncbi:MAG: cellulase family glycosylhydrolase [Anaerolineae bacterium]|nr:cellulase family glycosylhydrolase [Anaerolineae bacterium]
MTDVSARTFEPESAAAEKPVMVRILSRAARWMALAVGVVLLLTVPMSFSDPFMGFAVTEPPFVPLTYSIQTFLWWDTGSAGLHMDWVQRMAFSHVKQTFAWKDIQPEPDVWHFERADQLLAALEDKNLRVVARLTDAPHWAHPSLPDYPAEIVDVPPDDVQDFAIYCGTLASRYAGRIDAYQVWNEPNLAREWGGRTPDASSYVALLGACSEAIRAADPGAIIISAGLAPTGNYDANALPDDVYLQQMYDQGFQQYVDVVGAHAPGYSPPAVPPEDGVGGYRFFTFRRPEDLRRIMVRNGDAARQMAILETGYTTDPIHESMAWFAVSEPDQARYLVEAYTFAAEHWRPWVGLMSAIYIADTQWMPENEEYWWAVTTPEGYTRPAYIELANMAKFCGDHMLPPRVPDSAEALGLAPVYPCS